MRNVVAVLALVSCSFSSAHRCPSAIMEAFWQQHPSRQDEYFRNRYFGQGSPGRTRTVEVNGREISIRTWVTQNRRRLEEHLSVNGQEFIVPFDAPEHRGVIHAHRYHDLGLPFTPMIVRIHTNRSADFDLWVREPEDFVQQRELSPAARRTYLDAITVRVNAVIEIEYPNSHRHYYFPVEYR